MCLRLKIKVNDFSFWILILNITVLDALQRHINWLVCSILKNKYLIIRSVNQVFSFEIQLHDAGWSTVVFQKWWRHFTLTLHTPPVLQLLFRTGQNIFKFIFINVDWIPYIEAKSIFLAEEKKQLLFNVLFFIVIKYFGRIRWKNLRFTS